jgi:hypothetical protein
MACEVKYDLRKGGPDQRIADRLKNSGDAKHADYVVHKGEGPTRAITNIHHSRVQQYGDGHPGEGDIRGNKRGVV